MNKYLVFFYFVFRNSLNIEILRIFDKLLFRRILKTFTIIKEIEMGDILISKFIASFFGLKLLLLGVGIFCGFGILIILAEKQTKCDPSPHWIRVSSHNLLIGLDQIKIFGSSLALLLFYTSIIFMVFGYLSL